MLCDNPLTLVLLLSPRLEVFDPISSLWIQLVQKRNLASSCCCLIFFLSHLPGGIHLPLSSDVTFDFEPATLLSYYSTRQKARCRQIRALYFYSSNEEASVLLNAITQMRWPPTFHSRRTATAHAAKDEQTWAHLNPNVLSASISPQQWAREVIKQRWLTHPGELSA